MLREEVNSRRIVTSKKRGGGLMPGALQADGVFKNILSWVFHGWGKVTNWRLRGEAFQTD